MASKNSVLVCVLSEFDRQKRMKGVKGVFPSQYLAKLVAEKLADEYAEHVSDSARDLKSTTKWIRMSSNRSVFLKHTIEWGDENGSPCKIVFIHYCVTRFRMGLPTTEEDRLEPAHYQDRYKKGWAS